MMVAALADEIPLPFSDPFPGRSHGPPATKRLPSLRRSRKTIDQDVLVALTDTSRVLFLDVETTGLSRYYDELTLVGWLIGGVYQAQIAGDDPEKFLSDMRSASALVTFNGTLFDLAFLTKSFPNLRVPAVHADLRFLARRAGLFGGQKEIEKILDIKVRKGLEDLSGTHAVLLWHRYLRGDTEALRRLIDYNRCDVIAMRCILDEVLDRLVSNPDFWLAGVRFSASPYTLSGWAAPTTKLPLPSQHSRTANNFPSLFAGTPAEHATIIGIDLTGSEVRPSGWCLLRGAIAETEMLATDDEMVARIAATSPALVSIDSPLSLPFGRVRVEDDDPGRSEFGIMRRCERELKRRGINVYPCLLPSMQRLTKRGMKLACRLRRLGIPVIESYPGAAQDIMAIPRKGAGESFLKSGLEEFGIAGDFQTRQVRHDELDAITSALVGSFFLAGRYEALTGPMEDALIIPDIKARPGAIAIGISGRISAGKTTAARFLERQGFAYTRFSLVVDEEIEKLGESPTREARQRVGLEINRTKGQRWLCEQTLKRVDMSPLIVVDGLRFLEDRAFLVERFGSRFLHLHIAAPLELRKRRFRKGSGPSLEEADASPVESEIDRLGNAATASIDNSSTIDNLGKAVASTVERFKRKVGEECQSQLS